MPTTEETQIVNFTIGDVNYGVPVEQVREVRDMQTVTPVPGAPSYVEGVTNLRGQVITIMDLRKRLNIKESEEGGKKIIVIEMGKAAVGVVVDTVTEVTTLDGADLDKNLQTTTNLDRYVVGVGKQENKLIIVLDLTKIISDKNERPKNQKKSINEKNSAMQQVLVS